MATFALLDQTSTSFSFLNHSQFLNTQITDTNIVVNKNHAATLQVAKESFWPITQVFTYSFIENDTTHRDIFREFIEDFAGQPIFWFDHDDIWRYGFIRNDKIGIKTTQDSCAYEITFSILQVEVNVPTLPTIIPADPDDPASFQALYMSRGFEITDNMDSFVNGVGIGGGTWTARAAFPSYNNTSGGMGSKAANLKGVFWGGSSSESSNESRDTSHYIPPAAGVGGGSFLAGPDTPSARPDQMAGFVINDSVHSVGGDGTGFSGDGQALYIGGIGSWTVSTDLPLPGRKVFRGCTLGDKGYVAGGLDITDFGSDPYLRDQDEFTPGAGTWIAKQEIFQNRKSEVEYIALDGKGYLFGGETEFISFLQETNEYTPSDVGPGFWTTKAVFPFSGGGFGANHIEGDEMDGNIYISMGGNAVDFTEYTPDTYVTKAPRLQSTTVQVGFTLAS